MLLFSRLVNIDYFKNRYRRFVLFYGWLFSSAWKQFQLRLIAPIISGLCSVSFQVAAIAVVYKYAKHLLKGSKLEFYGVTFGPITSVSLLCMVSVVGLLLLILSAVTKYYGTNEPVKIGCELEGRLMRELLSAIRLANYLKVPPCGKLRGASAMVKILLSDTRACGRAVMMGLLTVPALCTFVVSLGTLVWVNFLMTLALVPVALLYGFGVYKIGLGGVRDNKELEQLSSEMAGRLKGVLDNLTRGDNPENLHEYEGLKNYLSSYNRVYSLPYKSYLITDLFFALVVTIVLFGGAFSMIVAHIEVSSLVVYLVSMKYGVGSLRQMIARFTVMNRFFANVVRVKRVLDSSSINPISITAGQIDVHWGGSHGGNVGSIAVLRESPAILFSRLPVSKLSVQPIVSEMIGETRDILFRAQVITSLSEEEVYDDAEFVFIPLRLVESHTSEELGDFLSKLNSVFVIVFSNRMASVKLKGVFSAKTPVLIYKPDEGIVWGGTLERYQLTMPDLKLLWEGRDVYEDAGQELLTDLAMEV
ncbi:MAG: ABC transporter ATP-binding protein [Candidatus Dadabacteria bacterium]|nr:MAG: ABC transporter ATP-binding protein [Candidatus Dadabacteria bacterium]